MKQEPEQLGDLFSYKAEWLNERLFELYREPEYFPEMTADSPCVLIGGRGTGKTTVLRGLSYVGQFALGGCDKASLPRSAFFGFYYKVNTNRTTAFTGKGIGEADWVPIFAHYVNLLLCELVCKFLLWYREMVPTFADLGATKHAELAASLHLPPTENLDELERELRLSLRKFEALLNNLQDGPPPPLSIQGAPIDIFLEGIQELSQFSGKKFFFLLDEYENFLDYQQQVVNTLIKHCSPLYSFKVGVRELGWRRRTALNEAEQLISPADYIRINISEKLAGTTFDSFANDVCMARLSKLREQGHPIIQTMHDVFPGLDEEEEALRLGVMAKVEEYRSNMPEHLPENLTPLEQYFLYTWAKSRNLPLAAVRDEFLTPDGVWLDRFRYGNYRHSLLFAIRRGKTGIRKYYCGWDVFLKLASTNIRYLLELVDNSFALHMKAGGALGQPINQETQTKAAQAVGKKNLSELEGLTIFGAQLTKLLLSTGRVFQVMASDPLAHTPEVNQFHLEDDDNKVANEAVETLIKTAVMHLALVRTSGTKLADESDTREYDYSIHPIFCPFFVFSYRRKRKMLLHNEELLGLVQAPQETIQLLLSRNNRSTTDALPEQAQLFGGFYGLSR